MSDHKTIANDLVDGFLDRSPLAEPDELLAHRVMARLRAEESHEEVESNWLDWRWAAVAACALIVMAAVWVMRPVARPRETAVNVPATATPAKEAAKKTVSEVPERKVTTVRQSAAKRTTLARPEPAVRQAMFPAPAPLSEQERMALIYLRRTPRVEMVANAKPDLVEEWLINQARPETPLSHQYSQNTK